MLFGHLHNHREVVRGLGGGENVHSLFREHRVGRVVIDFYNVQLVRDDIEMSMRGYGMGDVSKTHLCALCSPYGEGKQIGWCRGTIQLELGE